MVVLVYRVRLHCSADITWLAFWLCLIAPELHRRKDEVHNSQPQALASSLSNLWKVKAAGSEQLQTELQGLGAVH